MPEIPPVSLALEALGVPHRVFTHPGPVESLEQAARERGHRPEQVVRSILFRLKADEYVMVLVAGPAQVSWRALRKHVGQSRISMATEDEVLDVTGYAIGAVGPFGLPRRLKLLVDPGVLAEEEISIGSGLRGTAVILSSRDLIEALPEAEVVALVSADEQP
ncbi:MAG: aminoacyl-tRNA deacylase [Bacteroidota bacterium]